MTYVPSKAEIVNYVNRRNEEIRQYANKTFGMNIAEFRVTTTFKNTKRLGLGGIKDGLPNIRLNLHDLATFPVLAYTEYRSIEYTRGINGFDTTDWKEWLDGLLLHEFAHVVQFGLKYEHDMRFGYNTRNAWFENLGQFESGHGPFFQRIYLRLREEFLNDRIRTRSYSRKFMFDKPAELRVRPVTVSSLHGKKCRLDGRVFEVVDYIKTNRKYPIIVQNGTKRYKMSKMQFAAVQITD